MSVEWTIFAVTLFALALPWILKVVFPHKVTMTEIVVSMVVSLIASAICFGIIFYSTPTSTEILNGRVTDKKRVEVDCDHHYCCNYTTVCTGSGETRSCTRTCTAWCDRHPYDVDWRVYHNISMLGSYINIPRLDSQGKREPPRWSEVIVGEPFSQPNTYTDYIKMAPNSLHFRENVFRNEEYDQGLPSYPHVHDIYRSRHVFSTHPMSSEVLNEWNSELRNRLGDWGPNAQMNMLIIFTQHDRAYVEYMKNEWLGGRKNDAILFFNVDEEFNLNWFDVFSWSKNEYFNSILRTTFTPMKSINMNTVMSVIDENVKHFERIEMEDYSYLKNERTYTKTQIISIILIQILLNLGISFIAVKFDWFEGNTNNSYRLNRYSRRFTNRYRKRW